MQDPLPWGFLAFLLETFRCSAPLFPNGALRGGPDLLQRLVLAVEEASNAGKPAVPAGVLPPPVVLGKQLLVDHHEPGLKAGRRGGRTRLDALLPKGLLKKKIPQFRIPFLSHDDPCLKET